VVPGDESVLGDLVDVSQEMAARKRAENPVTRTMAVILRSAATKDLLSETSN
jgi:hypothetical protein